MELASTKLEGGSGTGATTLRLRDEMTGEWWQGVQPGVIPGVMMPNNLKVKSDMRVTTEGIFWGDKGNKRVGFLDCPWRSLRMIEVGDHAMRKGKQRSSFGIGPLGVAFVAANAVHNARAKQLVQFRLIRLTDVSGKQHNYLTQQSKEAVWAVLRPASIALAEHVASLTPTPSGPIQGASIADELKKMAELHESGVLSDDEFATQKAKLLES